MPYDHSGGTYEHSGGTYAVTVEDMFDDLIHRWKIDEGSGSTVSDSEGSADGSLIGASWVSNSDYVGGYAVEFDGTDDRIDIDSNITDLGNTGTWAVTAKFRSFNDSVGYIGLHDAQTEDDRLYLRHESDGEIRIGIADDIPLTGFTVSTDTFYRFVLTWEDKDYELYINDDLEYSGTFSDDLNTTTDYFWTYGQSTNESSRMDGFVDDGKVSDTKWSEGEIEADYDAQPWS